MKLAKCPMCGELIDLDLIDPLDLDTVIGCGLKEDVFEPCKGCPMENDTDERERYRENDELTPTTVKDYQILIKKNEVI